MEPRGPPPPVLSSSLTEIQKCSPNKVIICSVIRGLSSALGLSMYKRLLFYFARDKTNSKRHKIFVLLVNLVSKTPSIKTILFSEKTGGISVASVIV